MTKLLPLTFLCALLSVSVLSAQSSNKITISTGIGLAPVYHGKNANTDLPALSLNITYQISETFALGAYTGYAASTSSERIFSDGLTSKMENKTTAFAIRGEFKRDLTDKFELYGGLMLGYKAFQLKEIDTKTGLAVEREPGAPTPYNPNPPKGDVLYSGFFGAKYYFKDHVGAFGEIGYGLSLFTVGTSFRF